MIRFLDLTAQYRSIKSELDQAVEDVFTTAAFVGGAAVADFEADFAEYQQVANCIGVANGTDALEIAIEALRLPKNSEIIVPANSFVASSEAVTRSGHRVVFADIDPETYLLNPQDVERRIGRETSAIMPVHLYGQPAPMRELSEIAARHGLRIIEDCAQAHGAEIGGIRVGNFGDVGTFSFYPGKNLGAAGDAGAVVTNNRDIAVRCRMIANHGRLEKYNHEFEGRNSRLDGLQARILSVKLGRLDGWTTHRRRVAEAYIRELSDVDEVDLPLIVDDVRHVFHLFVIRARHRDELRAYLGENEIQTGVHYPIALPKLKAYDYLGQGAESMVANTQDNALLSLPIGEHLDDSAVVTVSGAIKRFYDGISEND